MWVIKIAMLGLVAVLTAIWFKENKAEYAIYIVFTVSLIIAAYIVTYISQMFDLFRDLQVYMSGAQKYIAILMKIIGITYISELSAGICKDAGYQSIASQIEVFGKICILLCGLPVMVALLETLQSFG